jgi:hypothetical protein
VGEKKRSETHWDSIDEAEWESFPASDPPAIDALFDVEPPPQATAGGDLTMADAATDREATALDDVERSALREALDDEYRSWATYDQVIRDFGPERPFTNIRDAEQRHIEALHRLFERYELEVPQNTWPGRVQRYASIRAACEAGIEAEIENGALYERLMQSTRREDILRVFENLRRASEERHLEAFRRCASRGPGRGRGGPGRGRGRRRGWGRGRGSSR